MPEFIADDQIPGRTVCRHCGKVKGAGHPNHHDGPQPQLECEQRTGHQVRIPKHLWPPREPAYEPEHLRYIAASCEHCGAWVIVTNPPPRRTKVILTADSVEHGTVMDATESATPALSREPGTIVDETTPEPASKRR